MASQMYKEIYDISVLLGGEEIAFPGDTPYCRDLVVTIEQSGICDVSRLTLSSHAGTHLDAPSHQIKSAKSIDQYPLERFIIPAHVVQIEDKELIKPAELERLDIREGEALLFRTDNSASGKCVNGVFSEKFVYLSAEAADLCVERRVSMVGIDYVSIDRFGDEANPAHKKLLGNDILILENINLKEVVPGRYILLCLPLKIKCGEGSPVRAILAR